MTVAQGMLHTHKPFPTALMLRCGKNLLGLSGPSLGWALGWVRSQVGTFFVLAYTPLWSGTMQSIPRIRPITSAWLPALVVALASGTSAAPLAAQEVHTRVTGSASPNGSASITAAGSLSDWSWTEVGVDMSLASSNRVSLARYAVPLWTQSESAGAVAWARMSLPSVSNMLIWEKGAVDVRMDPTQDASTLATNFSREWVIGPQLKASLSDSYSVTMNLGGAEEWQTGKAISLSLPTTGTTLSLATLSTSSDRSWQPSLTASQNLMGPVVISTTVADGGSTLTQSITAGFRGTW